MLSFAQRQARARGLRAVPLEWVLRVWGARVDPGERCKWHTQRGVLSVNGARFMNWSQGVGGGGAIDLVMHLTGLKFQAAADWLTQHLGAEPWTESVVAAPGPGPLQLPAPDPTQLGRVEGYLLRERRLPVELLSGLLRAGTLYADGHANAVFLLRDPQHVPVGAELRGTRGPWRGMAPGSRKDLGYFSVGAQTARTLILCESAIDALSCLALHPEHRCISTAGARPHPRWLPRLLAQGRQILCGFDADAAGEQMAGALMRCYPAVQRLRPRAHDWNDELKACGPVPPAWPTAELLLLGKKKCGGEGIPAPSGEENQ